MAFVAGDQILGFEICADHQKFEAKWPMLLNAAVVDALVVSTAKKRISAQDLQDFFDSAVASNVRKHTPVSAGKEFSVATAKVLGSLLFDDDGQLLHARLLPQHEIKLEAEFGKSTLGAAEDAASELIY